jgi:phosphohistidine phosphatase
MLVYLFRHGPAGRRDPSRWPDDSLRPLTPRGVERTRQAARGLARIERDATAIWTSPLLRAMQTATILSEELGLEDALETTELLAPGDAHRGVIHRLAEADPSSNIFLVGHEPDLGRLAGYMLFGAPASSLPLKKAGLCVVAFDGAPHAGTGELEAFMPPKLLRRLARKGARV